MRKEEGERERERSEGGELKMGVNFKRIGKEGKVKNGDTKVGRKGGGGNV